ncbi:hypothetical protein FB451DRAFT_1179051 [Mycena latifolia]|nr:hypothetical protein FB451DRAFT_1179051 [Mycena latifolia]
MGSARARAKRRRYLTRMEDEKMKTQAAHIRPARWRVETSHFIPALPTAATFASAGKYSDLVPILFKLVAQCVFLIRAVGQFERGKKEDKIFMPEGRWHLQRRQCFNDESQAKALAPSQWMSSRPPQAACMRPTRLSGKKLEDGRTQKPIARRTYVAPGRRVNISNLIRGIEKAGPQVATRVKRKRGEGENARVQGGRATKAAKKTGAGTKERGRKGRE